MSEFRWPTEVDLAQRADGGWVLSLKFFSPARTEVLAGEKLTIKESRSFRTIECDAKTAQNLRTLLAPIVRVS